MITQNYLDFLRKSAEENNSIVCVGLDPIIDAIKVNKTIEDPNIDTFSAFIAALFEEMDNLNIHPSAIKPNHGFYATHNDVFDSGGCVSSFVMDGYFALGSILNALDNTKIPVIFDSKRGDIGTSSKNYAIEAFEVWRADAVTVHPYMGIDSIKPFAEYTKNGKGVYILNRTSNPSASDFQNLKLENGDYFYMHVAKKIVEWAKQWPGVGAVVGATSLAELYEIASLYAKHQIPLLIPGVGGQGGKAEDVISTLKDAKYPLELARINSSSGITHPWVKNKDLDPGCDDMDAYVDISVKEVEKLNKAIAFSK